MTPQERSTFVATVQTLPQARFLDEPRINYWLDRVEDVDPGRIDWHIQRLRGFGGSEIGSIVEDEGTSPSIFRKTPRELVADKLMLGFPTPQTGDTRRGTFMEPFIRDRFREQMNAVPMQRELDIIARFLHPKHPWLVGNPDDLVVIDGKHYLVDYKSPSGNVAEDFDRNGISFDYIAQLHHYHLICLANGIRIDGLLLCGWDCKDWDIVVRTVEHDRKLSGRIIEAGDYYWNDHVLKNDLPAYRPRKQVPIETSPQAVEHMDRLVNYALIGKIATEKAEELKSSFKETALSGHLNAEEKVSVGMMDIALKRALSVERVEERILEMGKNLEDYPPRKVINLQKLAADLENLKIDTTPYEELPKDVKFDVDAALADILVNDGTPRERFEEAVITMRLPRSKKDPRVEQVDNLKKGYEVIIDDLVEASLKKEVVAEAEARQEIEVQAPAPRVKRPAM